MIQILKDFKPILDLDLYSEHMPEERITGSKIGLDLSARSTYTRVYTVAENHTLPAPSGQVTSKVNVCACRVGVTLVNMIK